MQAPGQVPPPLVVLADLLLQLLQVHLLLHRLHSEPKGDVDYSEHADAGSRTRLQAHVLPLGSAKGRLADESVFYAS